ncbi:MAG TPA: hypothetical protein V6D22_13655 [Candidatus Obscuribacterales bacterium]
MRKIVLAILTLFTVALPAVAQVSEPLQFEYKFRAPALFTKTAVFTIGSGGQKMDNYGTIFRTQGTVSSVTSGTTTVGVTLPARTLISNGHGIRLRVAGRCAANANAKTINVVFGSATIQILNAVASNGKDFYADVMIYRTGLNAQQISVAGYANGALIDNLSTATTQVETGTLALQVQVPASTGAADVVINDVSIFGESG